MNVETANKFFLVLTLAANVAVVVLAAIGLQALLRASRRSRGMSLRTSSPFVAWIGPQARPLALFVAAISTAGSLYYSEVAHFVPCELCWYQRICMYPLAAILLVGVVRRDADVRWYAAPFVVVGAPLSLYHWLVERAPAFAHTSSCSITAPCTSPYFEELGYVTLAFMAMSAFLLIGALLLVDRADSRRRGDTPEAPVAKDRADEEAAVEVGAT
jgi:disulfide bond formation protein DsbB